MKKFIALIMKEKQSGMKGRIVSLTSPSAYKKLGQFFFHTKLTNLFKQSYIILLQVINILTISI